jgi:hypothetical protein
LKRRRFNDEKYFGIAAADLFVALFSIMSLLFVVHDILPIAEKSEQNKEQTVGIVCAELSWPEDRDVDLDLWGQSPTDADAVGYSHTHGQNLSLLRDVVGHRNNPSKINQELMCANAEVDGEWIFNVHYFSNHGKDADATIPWKDDNIDAVMVLSENTKISPHKWVANVHLDAENEERTMFRFRVEGGRIIDSSFNTLDSGLRTGSGK